MFGDIYPMKYMEKATDTFKRMKFQLSQVLPSLNQNLRSKQRKQDILYVVIDTSFRLHGEFYAEKELKVFLWNPQNVFTRMHRRKEGKIDVSCTSSGRDDQIATIVKLLNVIYESYGFNAI